MAKPNRKNYGGAAGVNIPIEDANETAHVQPQAHATTNTNVESPHSFDTDNKAERADSSESATGRSNEENKKESNNTKTVPNDVKTSEGPKTTNKDAVSDDASAQTEPADADRADSQENKVPESEQVVDETLSDDESELTEAAMKAAAEALEKAQEESKEWQDKYLRLHAEWDTYRRRTNEQRADEKERATEELVENLLPILDDFERSIDYAEEHGETGLLEGVRAVQTKLLDALAKSGLVTINPLDEAFDALEHQAVATVENTDVFDETVHEVYQKGYKMGKKVLRPAMVTVSQGGPQREKDSSEDEQEQ